ncbi:MAG: radical SAM protein [Lachnospiraceae bacterium]|nr:radical SAM protein [Lachnospiraceae bacterium]
MFTRRRELAYAKENFNEVFHTTLNPGGPGVVRIHLIPPKVEGKQLDSSVVIINGQDVLPINRSWSILLAEFIKEVNLYAGKELNDADVERIMENTYLQVKKVYKKAKETVIRNDIYTIMKTFQQVAYGETVEEEIGYVSLGNYAKHMKAPHRMDIMVSAMTKDGAWHCNQKCVHCYAAGQEQAEEKELSTKDWKEVLDKCREIGIPQITFTGGEPTMREDLFELIAYAKWFVSRLNTNGVRLTREYCKGLKEAELDSIQITFYSQEADIHNQLVGAKNYDKTVEGIKNALEEGLNVSINTPLCTLNKDYVKTLAFLKDMGIMYVTCSGLITTGNATKEASVNTQLTKEEMKEILKDAAEYCYSNGMEISFTSPGWVEDGFLAELSMTTPGCGACLSNMAITPSGNVVPCQSWLSGDVLGNILTDSWESIWNSDKCKERRAYSAEKGGDCPLRKR